MLFKAHILQVTTILIVVLISQATFENVTMSSFPSNSTNPEAEFVKKASEFASRLLWMDKIKGRRKFFLPKGTLLTITPKITLPVFRNKPFGGGLNSDIQASWIFYMNFDKLGMTSDTHPWPFDMPPFYPFGSLMRPHTDSDHPKEEKEKDEKPSPMHSYDHKPFPNIRQESTKEDHRQFQNNHIHHAPFPTHYSGHYNRFNSGRPIFNRKPRSVRGSGQGVMSLPSPENIHGGERAIILPSIENLMSNFGFEGRACLARAICEIHLYPLANGFGLFGEMLTLFFSISESPYAETHMPEYLRAEMDGKAGDCSFYSKNCTKSIFTTEPNVVNPVEINDINV